MSESEIRNKISAQRDKITKLEVKFANQEASAEKEVDAEYNNQIATAESYLTTEQGALEEINEKVGEWVAKKKEKSASVKFLHKEVALLIKQKANSLKSKLKTIHSEQKGATSAVKSEIKVLRKELALLEKAQQV